MAAKSQQSHEVGGVDPHASECGGWQGIVCEFWGVSRLSPGPHPRTGGARTRRLAAARFLARCRWLSHAVWAAWLRSTPLLWDAS